ncbi:MAG: hypothetical protein IPP14_09715 [Planctomycetes bacterium]|nr:hypothetical protein [Planctomycetota bacterium]
MAKQPTGTRSIRLPGGQPAPAQRPQQQRPAPQRGPAQSGGDDMMQALDANAEVRDRSQLPSKVKVITPQVILNLVHSITDRFGDSVDRTELDTLVVENTQMRMQLQQSSDRLEQYKGEYKKIYDRFVQAQQMVQQAQAGQADVSAYTQQYQDQIADLQQRNAQAVDTYTAVQQQLDDALAQFDQAQADMNALQEALHVKDEEIAQLNQQVEEAASAGAAQQELEEARNMIVELRQQLEDMQNQSAEASEGLNQASSAQQELELQVQAAEARLAEVEGELNAAREDVERLNAAQAEAEKLKKALAEKEEEVSKLKKGMKEGERSAAKTQNMEIELEQLRSAEGQWLEEKRRLASQLSNETNNRREAEQKLKAIEKGEMLPEAAKAIEEKAKALEAEVTQQKQANDKLKKDLEQAKAKGSQADSVAAEAEKLRNDIKSKQDEIKAKEDELKKEREALGKAGNAAKELATLSRKYENVEAELESLRAAEGKWLEEKRRMAAQLSNETNLRRELEEKLKKELADEKIGREADKKKIEALEAAAGSSIKALKEREIAERSLSVIEDENAKLLAERDRIRGQLDSMKSSGGEKAAQLAIQLEEARKQIADTDRKLAARHEHVAKLAPELDAAKQEVERLRKELADANKGLEVEAARGNQAAEQLKKVQAERDAHKAELEKQKAGNGASSAELDKVKTELKTTEATRAELAKESKELRRLLEELNDAQKEDAEGVADQVEALEKKLSEAESGRAKMQGRLEAAEKQLQEAQAKAQSEATAAAAARKQMEEELRQAKARAAEAEKLSKASGDADRKLAARDQQLEVLQRQLVELKEELKLEEEERDRQSGDVLKAREAEKRALEEAEKLERELGELEQKLAAAEARAKQTAQAAESVADGKVVQLENEIQSLRERNEQITAKRDDMVRGLERAVAEIEELKRALAEREVDKRTRAAELAEAQKAEQVARAEAQKAAEAARAQLQQANEKAEKATEKRFEAEKQLVEARTLADSEKRHAQDLDRRIKSMEEDLRRERSNLDKSAPAAALESLNQQIASERSRLESEQARHQQEADTLHKRLAEAELRENELASQLEGIELSQQDVMRAKALAGQRRAQIERMQSDVEGARRQVKETETYWKGEMNDLGAMVKDHLEAAERGDEGADQKLVKLLETLKVGVFDKYATLRRKHNRTQKELDETSDKLKAVERLLAKREEEEARLRKAIDKVEIEAGIKKPKPESKPGKGKKK